MIKNMITEEDLRELNMLAKIQNLKTALQTCGKIPIFEIEVKDITTGEDTWIQCDIEIDSDAQEIQATRAPINSAEMESDKIAYNKIPIDLDNTLDGHLSALYEVIIEDIIANSEYFVLK